MNKKYLAMVIVSSVSPDKTIGIADPKVLKLLEMLSPEALDSQYKIASSRIFTLTGKVL